MIAQAKALAQVKAVASNSTPAVQYNGQALPGTYTSKCGMYIPLVASGLKAQPSATATTAHLQPTIRSLSGHDSW